MRRAFSCLRVCHMRVREAQAAHKRNTTPTFHPCSIARSSQGSGQVRAAPGLNLLVRASLPVPQKVSVSDTRTPTAR